MEIKVVEIKEETKEEAEEDNCQQYALKRQKLLAQGNTLGLECDILKSPCKGKSFKYVKLLPLQGDLVVNIYDPGRCPGLGASALSGRAA